MFFKKRHLDRLALGTYFINLDETHQYLENIVNFLLIYKPSIVKAPMTALFLVF